MALCLVLAHVIESVCIVSSLGKAVHLTGDARFVAPSYTEGLTRESIHVDKCGQIERVLMMSVVANVKGD